MSDLDATTPRIFLARHGETAWTISGQHTGISDIPLTALGERQVSATGSLIVGAGKLLDPSRVVRVWVSPRRRALRTFQLLFGGGDGDGGAGDSVGTGDQATRDAAGVVEEVVASSELRGTSVVTVTEEIREWDYGDYEGRQASEVREDRRRRGLDAEGQSWSVWRDGCEGGEDTARSKRDVENRLDRLIEEVKNVQRPYMDGKGHGDVVLVAHGLILRCFVKRWLKLAVDDPLPLMFSPGSIAVLSYKDHDVNKPAFHLGLSLPVT